MAGFNRRDLFVIGSAAAGSIAMLSVLEGCAGLSQQASQLVQDVEDVANGLNGVLPDVQAVTGVATSVITSVEAGIADIKAVASSIVSAAGSASDALPGLISHFAASVSSVTQALGVQNGLLGTVLQAAQVLVPIIMGAAGVALAGPSVPTGMLPAQARGVLKAASAR